MTRHPPRDVPPGAGTRVTAGLPTADRVLLYATVFLTGASVMILELLGTRIVGPYYGVSLFVWSSLISVALIALSAGYFLAGWLADREPGPFRLWHAIAVAGLPCTSYASRLGRGSPRRAFCGCPQPACQVGQVALSGTFPTDRRADRPSSPRQAASSPSCPPSPSPRSLRTIYATTDTLSRRTSP